MPLNGDLLLMQGGFWGCKMAKILVYEDSEEDIIIRYGDLTPKHELHVRGIPDVPRVGVSSDGEIYDIYEWDITNLKAAGFNPENIINSYGDPSKENADIYFVDGLRGKGLSIL